MLSTLGMIALAAAPFALIAAPMVVFNVVRRNHRKRSDTPRRDPGAADH